MPAITKPTSPFAFDGHPVRVELDANGEPWFVAKDVAEALGYEWKGSGTVQHVPDRWRMVLSVGTTSGRKDALALSESGMNFFVMRSDKPAAIPFQEWIAGEVLPSIRRTGSYTKPVAAPSTSDALALAHALIAAEASNRALRADNAQVSQQLVSIQAELDTAIDVASTATERADAAEPLAKVAKEFLHTEGGLTLAVVGTQLGQSQQWMFRALREVGWIVKKSVGGKLQNLPSQRALDAGLMSSRISTHTDLEGRAHHSVQPLVTPRGARRLHELHAQGELGI
jgi:prophage antirepressor-like protein